MEKKGMSIQTKNRVAYISALCTVLFALFCGVLMYTKSDQILPLMLGIGALLYGPVCFAFYLIEVAKGLFKAEDDEEKTETE